MKRTCDRFYTYAMLNAFALEGFLTVFKCLRTFQIICGDFLIQLHDQVHEVQAKLGMSSACKMPPRVAPPPTADDRQWLNSSCGHRFDSRRQVWLRPGQAVRVSDLSSRVRFRLQEFFRRWFPLCQLPLQWQHQPPAWSRSWPTTPSGTCLNTIASDRMPIIGSTLS